MFSTNQKVMLQIHSNGERVPARIVQSTSAHLIVEIEGNAFPPIDTDVVVYFDHHGKQHQQSTTVSGHWQHSPKATIELARLENAVDVSRKLGAA